MRFCLAILFASLMCFLEIEAVVSDDTKPSVVEFVPPKDTLVTDAVGLVRGVDEVVRLKLDNLESMKESVLAIPLENKDVDPLNIALIKPSCGCLAAIASSLVIPSKGCENLYLKVRPTDLGPFSKKVTVTFASGSSAILIIESTVLPTFSVTPSVILLTPGDSDGEELFVRPNFGAKVEHVVCSDKDIALTKGKIEGQYFAALNARSLLRQAKIALSINMKHDYVLVVDNADAIRVSPRIILPRSEGEGHRVAVVAMSYSRLKDLDTSSIECRLSRNTLRCKIEISPIQSSNQHGVSLFRVSFRGTLDELDLEELQFLSSRSEGTKVLATSLVQF